MLGWFVFRANAIEVPGVFVLFVLSVLALVHCRSFGDSLLTQLTMVHVFPSGVLCLLCISPLSFVD